MSEPESEYLKRCAEKIHSFLRVRELYIDAHSAMALARSLVGPEAAEEKISYRTALPKARFNSEELDFVKAHSWIDLIERAMDKGYVPLTLPEECRTYRAWPSNSEVPVEAVDAGATWDLVDITWTIYLRRAV